MSYHIIYIQYNNFIEKYQMKSLKTREKYRYLLTVICMHNRYFFQA